MVPKNFFFFQKKVDEKKNDKRDPPRKATFHLGEKRESNPSKTPPLSETESEAKTSFKTATAL